MELEIQRSYFRQGTNGELYCNDVFQCWTIELPWLQNEYQISCIPEGKYPVVARYNKTFGWHLLIKEVPARKGILMHPANIALKELKGCIAPVSELTGIACGVRSKVALESILDLVLETSLKETVYLTIKSKVYDTLAKGQGTYA